MIWPSTICPIPAVAAADEFHMDHKALIAEYDRLRRLAHELDVQAETVDARLIEIERQLPDQYTYSSDPPLADIKRQFSNDQADDPPQDGDLPRP